MSSPENTSGWTVESSLSASENNKAFLLDPPNISVAANPGSNSNEQNITNTIESKQPKFLYPYQKNFIWDEHLSENGQKLYLLLLGDTGFTEHLPELAQMEGIDLDAGLAELRNQKILDENDAKIVRINLNID